MIKQGIINESILEKKFKILRTSILLGNISDREETIKKYEKSAREVDSIKRNVYEELLAGKLYVTTTLEDEQSRLKNLISFIENRVKERNDFIDDYLKVTTNFLDDLPKVSLEENLSDYKLRLANIDEYLNNCHEIEKETEKLKTYRDELEEKYENKANNEIINSKLEDELVDEFNKVIENDEYYTSLNYLDIDNEIDKLNNTLTEKLDNMNTFISSYQALVNAGISGSERDEYLSYVKDAKNEYYNDLEKKYLLNLYKLVLDKQSSYDTLYDKRLDLDNLLKEREQKRQELEIANKDILNGFINLCNEQFSVIKSQKYNIENIDKLILNISDCETKLEALQRANERKEIVDLLDEYSIKTPEIEKIDIPDEKDIHDEIIGDAIKVIPKADNMVVKIADPIKINVKNASDTAKLVMKKVVIVLEPKKFSRKRDKLKEAEELLDENKFTDLDISNKTNDTVDDVFKDMPTITLDTKEVDDSKEVKKIETVDTVKIHLPETDDVSIPTEIFVEEQSQNKKLDIFSETDPFLDDNQFELDNKKDDTIVGSMPQINNIGTVKPNSMLSKLEDVAKETDNIILPSMGLSNNNGESVPIVSENYIN